MPEKPITEESVVEEFEQLKCVNGAMYFGCVEEVCDCGNAKCANRQTVEMAEKEYKDWLRSLLHQKNEEKRKEAKKYITLMNVALGNTQLPEDTWKKIAEVNSIILDQ